MKKGSSIKSIETYYIII